MQYIQSSLIYLIIAVVIYFSAYKLGKEISTRSFKVRIYSYVAIIISLLVLYSYLVTGKILPLISGRNRYLAVGFIIITLLTIVIKGVKNPREKIFNFILLVIVLFNLSLSHFILPVLSYNTHRAMKTVTDINNICLQSTGYNCGPAAAVTVLKRYNIEAEEGKLSIAAFTNPIAGTAEDLLIKAIEDLYALKAEYKKVSSLKDLKTHLPAIAVIRHNFFNDHYVAVLNISDTNVIIGDPLKGKRSVSSRDFLKIWRKKIIIFNKQITSEQFSQSHN